ncbi:MAG: serine/threonine-protein kinase [Planctomycetaceae bacterium]|nr:serine/threonine-protein kinase [Planctomycetaceae bacterium]
MSDCSYRLKTSSGLSQAVTLESLRKSADRGQLEADAMCTRDNGQSWQPVAQVLKSTSGSSVPIDVAVDRKSAAAGDPANHEASETTTETSDQTQPGTAPDAGARKLKRLPVNSSPSRYQKRDADLKAKKDSRRKLSALVGKELSNGRYKVLSQFGSGSMAYVFRASDNRLETDVIIKIPKPEKITSDDFRERFRRESQLLVRLSHPHVVKVLDVGESGDLPYVVMQLLSGGTLSDRMLQESNELNQMSPQSLQSWLREVARALDFCYRKGMVHRDVKPANILFDDDQNPYVSDFGLTKIMHGEHTELCSSGTANGVVLGTPNYLPPEIILGASYDGRADQYSLALTVYHAMCGKPPMQGKSATATMINQTQKTLELLSSFRTDVPRELALAVQKGIDKNPDNRFESCEAFAEAVLECLRNDSSSEILLGGLNAAFAEEIEESAGEPAPSRNGSSRSSAISSSSSSLARSSSSSARRRAASSSSASSHSSSSSSRRTKASVSSTRPAKRKKSAPRQQPVYHDDWLDGNPSQLPPRRSSASRQKSKSTRAGGRTVTVFGMQMHPAALVLAAAMVLLPSTIFIGLWMVSSSPSRDEADFYVLPNTEGGQQFADTGNRLPEHVGAQPVTGGPSAPTPQRGFEDEPEDTPDQTNSPPTLAEQGGTQPPASRPPGSDRQVARTAAASSLPVTDGEGITRGKTQAVRAVIGRAVWDLERREQIGILEGSYPANALTALSASGSFFAAATESPGVQGTEVVVWNTATGKKVLTASASADRFVDAIVLANDRLLLGDRWSDELVVWDLETRRQRRPIRLADARFKQGNTSISHDGQFLSAVVNDQVRVFDAKEGNHVVTLQSAKSLSRRSERAQPLYASLQSLVFSPDNQELAALTTTGTPQFVCWNGRGEVILETGPSGGFHPHDEVTWFHSRKAWLLGAHVLDRSTSQVIASVQGVNSDRPSVELLDDDLLLVQFRSHRERLDIVRLPWDEIERAAQVSESDPAATLKAGRRVATRMRLEGVDSELSWELRRTLKKRLSELGLAPQETADVTIEIRVTSDGEKFVENRSLQLPTERRFDTVGRQPEGRAIVIEVRDRSQSEPVWSAVLCSDPDRLLRRGDEATSAVTSRLAQDLAQVALPYYLPTDPQFLALPVLLTPPSDSGSPQNLAIKPDAPERMATQDQPDRQRQ